YASRLTPELYTPAALRAFVSEVASLLRTPLGEVRQVLTAHELAKVVVTGFQSYEIRFYHRADIGDPDSDGEYFPTAAPYLYWRVDNPALGTVGRWRVTRVMNGQSV